MLTPVKTQAAVLEKIGQPLAIRELEMPDLKPGQVLVRVAYSGVCRSQLMEVTGGRGADPYLPHLLGHEGSGTVLSVGPGVLKVKPGDRVVLTWIKAAGRTASGGVYHRERARINAGPIVTFTELAIISEDRCVPLPEGIPMDLAALLGCAVPTGAGIVFNRFQPSTSHSIAVFGLGGVGR